MKRSSAQLSLSERGGEEKRRKEGGMKAAGASDVVWLYTASPGEHKKREKKKRNYESREHQEREGESTVI